MSETIQQERDKALVDVMWFLRRLPVTIELKMAKKARAKVVIELTAEQMDGLIRKNSK